MGKLESPRSERSRSQVRTVAGAGTGPGRIAQGGIRSARMEGKVGGRDVYVGVDVSKGPLDVALRPSGEFFSNLPSFSE